MKFEEDLQLSEDNVKTNKSKRRSFKLLGNAMLGKFSQRSHFSETLFVNSQEEMEKVFVEENVVDFVPISENICQLEILPPSDKARSKTQSGNCIIGAFVTAHARIQLHKDLMSLIARGFQLYYCDTDGIIFSDPNLKLSRPLPLSLSPCPGDYKHELGNQIHITSFACLARKTYSLTFQKKGKTKTETCVKSSGLSLSSYFAKEAISTSDFKILLANWQTKEMTIPIPQLRHFLISEEKTVRHKISEQKLSNKLDIQRRIQSVSSQTLPYGYTQ